jgi:hypothetical protein
MRLVFDHAGACAVRFSIAAAMVIEKPAQKKMFTFFSVRRALQRNVNKQ